MTYSFVKLIDLFINLCSKIFFILLKLLFKKREKYLKDQVISSNTNFE